MLVFFYGLFMDENLLAQSGIKPPSASVGYLNQYALHIGERATLVPRANSQAYGILMTITPSEAAQLYAEDSVTDYVPETVTVNLLDGTKTEAICYNLPKDKTQGTNKDYAKSLLALASEIGFPETYLAQIRQAGI